MKVARWPFPYWSCDLKFAGGEHRLGLDAPDSGWQREPRPRSGSGKRLPRGSHCTVRDYPAVAHAKAAVESKPCGRPCKHLFPEKAAG